MSEHSRHDSDYIRTFANSLRITREPARVMFPAELVSLLESHLHPRHWSVGVTCHAWGRESRAALGMAPHGTIWFASPTTREVDVFSVPADAIPYWPLEINPRWDTEGARWVGGGPVRGWRRLLADLVEEGHLKPSDHLSHLVGQDTKEIHWKSEWRIV